MGKLAAVKLLQTPLFPIHTDEKEYLYDFDQKWLQKYSFLLMKYPPPPKKNIKNWRLIVLSIVLSKTS